MSGEYISQIYFDTRSEIDYWWIIEGQQVAPAMAVHIITRIFIWVVCFAWQEQANVSLIYAVPESRYLLFD